VNKKLLFFLVFIPNLYAQSLFLSRVKNNTADTLYKVIVPDEDYEMLVPAGSEADFGSWLDLRRAGQVQLAVLQGEGEPIFVHFGPESAGCASDDAFAQSVIYWFGFPNASDEDKLYKTCCIESNNVDLVLTIHANGLPEIQELSLPGGK